MRRSRRPSALVERIAAALAPLEAVAAAPRSRILPIWRRATAMPWWREPATATARPRPSPVPTAQALAAAFADIAAEVGREPFPVAAADYPELFALAIDGRVVRRPGAPGSRIRIYGPLEARLTGVDRVVIGGLVEGVWPPDPRTDPWLSRPMRQALGLDLPERRIGLAAHDFAQLLGAREVFLTRSAKLAGAPTVASRFVQRLAAVAGERRWGEAAGAAANATAISRRSLDAPQAPPRPVAAAGAATAARRAPDSRCR